ncbi:MAG: DsbE family thiol:disulfide interchange protein [Proteobacteria bacterium]|nr:DsbE family thiol:disulfide interchange protein [Pseudomonadota bacterium]
MNRYLLPLAGFIVLVGFLAVGLKLDPKEIPSPLINKPAPVFSVPTLFDAGQSIGTQQLKGQVWLLNVWASWCTACRQEHPLLNEMAEQDMLPIIGLNYKDQRDDAIKWLGELGNPYTIIAHDLKGDVGIDFGVYGVPESFLIDKKGQIRYKQIGPFTVDSIQKTLIPLVKTLQAES